LFADKVPLIRAALVKTWLKDRFVMWSATSRACHPAHRDSASSCSTGSLLSMTAPKKPGESVEAEYKRIFARRT
jgi:hypothetical protein